MKPLKYTILFFSLTLLTPGIIFAKDAKEYLTLALQQDQAHRNQINQLHGSGNAQSQKHIKLVQSLEQAQHQLDIDNQQILDRIIEQLGRWPGINDVGENAAKIAMLLFKRSTPS
ncbi:MAG: hypothetical protein ACSHWU_09895, partial [Marinicella sp.]